jgi:hypothetical protein
MRHAGASTAFASAVPRTALSRRLEEAYSMIAASSLTLIFVLLVGMPFAWIAPLVLIVLQTRHRRARRAELAKMSPVEMKQAAIEWPFFKAHAAQPIVQRLRALLEADRYDVVLAGWRDLRLELIAVGDNTPGKVEFILDRKDEDLKDLLSALRSKPTPIRG